MQSKTLISLLHLPLDLEKKKYFDFPDSAFGNSLCTKGGFFSESAIRFSNLPISQKQIFQKTILNSKFKIPAHNSKQLIQISSSG